MSLLALSRHPLSHTIRELETRMGIRLLTRTTRSVSPTKAGERLLHTVGPRLEEIDAELAAISELREKSAGTIRLDAIIEREIEIVRHLNCLITRNQGSERDDTTVPGPKTRTFPHIAEEPRLRVGSNNVRG